MMSKKKKTPQRQCVGCGEMKNKIDLIRVIKTPEDHIIMDTSGKQNGRGAYLCNSIDCFEKARKSRGLERSLKNKIPEDVYEELAKELKAIDK